MKETFYLLLATFLLGVNFHLAKTIMAEAKFIEAGFWRFLFGFLALLVIARQGTPQISLVKKNLKGIVITGILGLFGFNLFFFLGLTHTSAINAALIISLNPLLTLLFSNGIARTPITSAQVVGIFFSMIGVAYLMVKGNLYDLGQIAFAPGDILILIANFFFALHHVWVKKYGAEFSSSGFTLLTTAACLIGFLLLLPFSGMERLTEHSIRFWSAAFGIGCVGTALAYYLWQKGIQIAGAEKAGIYMNIVPLSTASLAVFFGENLDPYHFVGGSFIGLGLIMGKIGTSKSSKALS